MGSGPGGYAAGLELEISASGLRNCDTFSKSDPRVSVFMMRGGKWVLIDRTETIADSLSPHFTKRISVDYTFHSVQRMKFLVEDKDARGADFLGCLEKDLADIVVSGSSTYRLGLDPEASRKKPAKEPKGGFGSITVRAHDVGGAQTKTRATVQFVGKNLPRKDGLWGKSDPYFMLMHVTGEGDASQALLYKSEVRGNTLSPHWSPCTFDITTRGMPPESQRLCLKIWDDDNGKEDDYMGKAEFTVADLRAGKELPVFDETRRAKDKRVGQVIIRSATFGELPSHVAYLQGGCYLRFVCAVDFTKSNGPMDENASLHHTDGVSPSIYGRALKAITTTLMPYMQDDQTMEAFAFGAINPATGQTGHDFPLNLTQAHDARVSGVENLMACYSHACKTLVLSAPTHFAPIVRRAMQTSQNPGLPSQHDQHYTVLLILTDGRYDDEDETVKMIIEASKTCPLSIVIIGVGTADFKDMRRLDGDSRTLRAKNGDSVARDIVDFVEYKPDTPPEVLAGSILKEVPGALVDYFVGQNIRPGDIPPFNPTL